MRDRRAVPESVPPLTGGPAAVTGTRRDAVSTARSGTLAGWRFSLVLVTARSGVTLTAAVKRTGRA